MGIMSSPQPPPESARPRGRVRAEILPPRELTSAQKVRMHGLMAEHFENVDRRRFLEDLDEKDWAVVLFDDAGGIQGFTTLALLEIQEGGRRVLGFYSGDTVLAREYRGRSGWLSVWSRHVFRTAAQFSDCRAFWILLTATHRTYRFLPAFFREFHPRPDAPIPPDWKRRLDAFVRLKFPEEYDPIRGVVALREPTPVRRPEEAQSDVPLDDPYAQFFVQRNPGFLRSDFLACITEIAPSNTTPLGRRVLEPAR